MPSETEAFRLGYAAAHEVRRPVCPWPARTHPALARWWQRGCATARAEHVAAQARRVSPNPRRAALLAMGQSIAP